MHAHDFTGQGQGETWLSWHAAERRGEKAQRIWISEQERWMRGVGRGRRETEMDWSEEAGCTGATPRREFTDAQRRSGGARLWKNDKSRSWGRRDNEQRRRGGTVSKREANREVHWSKFIENREMQKNVGTQKTPEDTFQEQIQPAQRVCFNLFSSFTLFSMVALF